MLFFGGFIQRVAFNAMLILGAAAVVLYLVNRAFKGRYNLRDKYLQSDQEANTARSRDVEPEYFYAPDLSALPGKKPEAVIKCAEQTMVYFPKKMTNIELKSAYGVANLEKVTGYEENYNRYISSLVKWADDLLEDGKESDAISILKTTVELGSEFRKGYMNLADYYTKKADANGLNHLLDRVAAVFTDEGIKLTLTKYIMDKKESL